MEFLSLIPLWWSYSRFWILKALPIGCFRDPSIAGIKSNGVASQKERAIARACDDLKKRYHSNVNRYAEVDLQTGNTTIFYGKDGYLEFDIKGALLPEEGD